jgi:LacI family transcriptional regulator
MTTMRDVARVAGVSAKTVSRVFNEDPHVTDETRDRVRWAMQKLNYVPNLLAKSFRAGADTAVGLAIPDIADPFFAEMTSSIETRHGRGGDQPGSRSGPRALRP